MSSSYFAKRVKWEDGFTDNDETVESEYLIGGRTRGIEGHLRGGGSNSKSPGFAAFFTHLSFLGILVISALLINSLVNSVHNEAYEILSIVGIVISCLVCVSALVSLCGLYQFDSHHTQLLLVGHLLAWTMLLIQVSYGGLITAYWGARAMPDILMTSPDTSPLILLDIPTPSQSTTPATVVTSASQPQPVQPHFVQQQQQQQQQQHTDTNTKSSQDITHLQQQQQKTDIVVKTTIISKSTVAATTPALKSPADTLISTQTQASPVHTDTDHPVASRPLIGILTISAVVTLAWCVVGLSAVNWPSITQLRVIKLNITLCALILTGIAVAIETLGMWTLIDTPSALGIAYDDVSSWSVYGVLVSSFFMLILALLLVRLLCVAGKEQELNVLHTRLTRRSAATSSSSTFVPVPSATTSSTGLGSGVRTNVGIVSTRAEHNAVKHQRTLSSLHSVMFLCVFVTAAIITFSIYTYNTALPSIDEEPRSQLLLTSSILGFAAPVFNFLTLVTCYQWRQRILDSNDSDIYSKHSHIYEPIV